MLLCVCLLLVVSWRVSLVVVCCCAVGCMLLRVARCSLAVVWCVLFVVCPLMCVLLLLVSCTLLLSVAC